MLYHVRLLPMYATAALLGLVLARFLPPLLEGVLGLWPALIITWILCFFAGVAWFYAPWWEKRRREFLEAQR